MTVTLLHHSCGHVRKKELPGDWQQRRDQINRLNDTQCPACRGYAAARHATRHLPDLTGSELQVRWATKIRARKLKQWKIDLKEFSDYGFDPGFDLDETWRQLFDPEWFEPCRLAQWWCFYMYPNDRPLGHLVVRVTGLNVMWPSKETTAWEKKHRNIGLKVRAG